MNTKIKQKWVEALRSGEYSQGRLQLYDGTNYCCLGVLCNLYMDEKNETWDYRTDEDEVIDSYYFDGEGELPPECVLDWAEIKMQDPLIKINVDLEAISLTELNDKLKYTFPQIADLIEAQL